MSGGGTQLNLRKYLGAIKDSTTVGLAKVNSDYKELDIAIVKATNHVERPAKEKHMRAIFATISASRPRADVGYCIHALARRLARTHNWAVALKTLIIIHRALREVDSDFREELMNYGRNRSHMLNLTHFRDNSSQKAWEYSSWVRTYALFLEERLECFRVLKYDIEMDPSRTSDLRSIELLEQLSALQQLLFRLLECQPQGAAAHNFIIQLAFSLVAGESLKLYNAISDGTNNLVGKFFEMQRHIAVRALEIYRKAGQQVERLSEFYEICKSINVWPGEKFIQIEKPSSSVLTSMEEYIRNTKSFTLRKDQVSNQTNTTPKEVMALENKKPLEAQEACKAPSVPHEPIKAENPVLGSSDLLELSSETNSVATELDDNNAMDHATIPVGTGNVGWESALVTAPSSNEGVAAASRLAGGMDMLILDSLYDEATRRTNENTSYNKWEINAMNG